MLAEISQILDLYLRVLAVAVARLGGYRLRVDK